MTKEELLALSADELRSLAIGADDTNMRCTDCTYCAVCTYCADCAYCADCTYCTDCKDCFKCSNQGDAQWMIANIQLSKEKYTTIMKKLEN